MYKMQHICRQHDGVENHGPGQHKRNNVRGGLAQPETHAQLVNAQFGGFVIKRNFVSAASWHKTPQSGTNTVRQPKLKPQSAKLPRRGPRDVPRVMSIKLMMPSASSQVSLLLLLIALWLGSPLYTECEFKSGPANTGHSNPVTNFMQTDRLQAHTSAAGQLPQKIVFRHINQQERL